MGQTIVMMALAIASHRPAQKLQCACRKQFRFAAASGRGVV
jgi:hypothetical protein